MNGNELCAVCARVNGSRLVEGWDWATLEDCQLMAGCERELAKQKSSWNPSKSQEERETERERMVEWGRDECFCGYRTERAMSREALVIIPYGISFVWPLQTKL